MTDTAELLTIPEVAERLRVSRRTAQRLIEAGRIRTVNITARLRRVEAKELAAYIAASRSRRVA